MLPKYLMPFTPLKLQTWKRQELDQLPSTLLFTLLALYLIIKSHKSYLSMDHKMIIILFILESLLLTSYSTTHWFLNNEGKIQAQMDSIYQLRRPYDFLALIQQEERAKHVEQLKKELVEQKAHIDKNEDKDTQLEDRIYRTYSDCILAGRPLTEFDLYASATLDLKAAADINIEDYLDFDSLVNTETYLTPDCESLVEIPFSMFLLEHLKGMRLRDNLTALPEDDLSTLSTEKDPNIWGHKVTEALTWNKTSWVLYTLAAQYWKLRGNTQEAVECIRKAIYFSTREHRYIPLFYLGNILHRSHESEDAATVLHMALDHHKRSAIIHEMLGCVYATVGYYNESVLCLENALHISPNDDNLQKLKHAVLCHAHLENALEKQLLSLQHTLNELRGYQKKHDEWLNLQQKLLLEQATPEMKLESRLEYEEQKIRESADGRGQDCFQYQQDGHTFLSCNMRRDQLEHQGSSTELLLDLQSLLHTVESETMRLGQQVLKRKPSLPTSVPFVTPLSPSNSERPKTLYNNHVSKLYGENFPTLKDCEKNLPLPSWDAFPTVFLPSENKGFGVDELFKSILVDFDEDLSPLCSSPAEFLSEIDNIPGIKEKLNMLSTQPDFQASPALNAYGLHLYDTETEVKLASAIRQEEPTRWVFLNLAGLYWRLNGNLINGIDCLRQAVTEVPRALLDVPLVNLASLLYKGGHIDDALTLTLKAMEVNATEVGTNFLLANLYFGKGNLTGAFRHYEKVLTAAPDHVEAQQYFTALACHIKNPKKQISQPTCSNDQNGDESCCPTGDEMGSQSPIVGSKTLEAEEDEESAEGNREKKCLSESSSGKKESADANKANLNKQIHVRIGLGPESSSAELEGGSIIEDDPLPDVLLRVREKTLSQAIPPHLCDKGSKLSDIKLFTSTWLSVSAKNIDLAEYLIPAPKEGTSLEEPICQEDFPASLHTFDHLAGVKHRAKLPHYPELGLKEAFQTLTEKTPQQMDLVATRIARSMKKNETSWVIATAAALYWRVLGNGHRAVDCLRMALHYAPRNMKDIPLISMANIFHRSDLLNNALIVGSMALEISPNFVVIHFTMANMYAAKGDFDKAIAFYQSTLSLQSTFEPARERLRIIQCAIVNSDSKL